MRRNFTILSLLALIYSQILFSQSDSAEHKETLSGKKGLMFSFSGLNLGGGLGGKYWIDSHFALRMIVNISYEENTLRNYSTSELRPSYDIKTTTSSFAPSFSIERHFVINNNISPYIGAGVSYKYGTHKRDLPGINGRVVYRYNSNIYSAHIFLGFEYWISEKFSFAGEQSLSATYEKDNESSSLIIKNSVSQLLFCVYF